MRELWKIIPRQYRHRTTWVTVSIFLRALLNFVGIATLIPIIALVLDHNAIVTNPYLAHIYSVIDASNYATFVGIICCAIIAIIVLKNIVILLLSRAENSYIYTLYKHLSKSLLLSYHQRGYEYIKHNNSATLTRNVNVVSLMFVAGVLKPMATIISEASLLLLIMGALTWHTPIAAMFTMLLFAPIIAIFYFAVRRQLHDIGERENSAQRLKNRIVAESFRGYVDIETNSAFPLIFSRFTDIVNDIATYRKRNATIGQLPQIFAEVGIAIALVLLVLASVICDNNDSAMIFGIYAVAAVRMIPSVRGIMAGCSTIRYNRHSTATMLDIERDIIYPNKEAERIELHSSIELRNISFTFSDATTPTIKDLSLTINKGERIGIQGSSGIGKTTLFNLILGLYTPTSGTITVNGTPLTKDNIGKWRNAVGYVPQSVFIAEASIKDNISLGCNKDKIDNERLMRAIEHAELTQFIDSLPNGVDTIIGEQGSRLSGGQQQRIGIARALYKGCDILLFDEATSSLDNHTEQSINHAIEHLSKEDSSLTIVAIAHRDSSLKYCDRIITME